MATRGKKEKEYPPMPANWMYKRGDVYMMDLNPYSGSEQGGVRPAIVVQNDDGNFYSNVLLVVPLTTQIKKRYMSTHFVLHNRFLSAPSKRLGKQKCHHSFSLAEFPLYHGSGSEKPQNRQQYPNHLSSQNSC